MMASRFSLLIDTVGTLMRVGLCRDGILIASDGRDIAKGQSRILPEMTQYVLGQSGYDYDILTQIICATGPGNFTGVRIGTSFARGIALATGIPTYGVTQFDLMRATIPAPATAPLYLSVAMRGDMIVLWRGALTPWVGRVQDIHEAELPHSFTLAGARVVEIRNYLAPHGYDIELKGSAGVYPLTLFETAAAQYGQNPAAPFYARPPDAAVPRVAPPPILDPL